MRTRVATPQARTMPALTPDQEIRRLRADREAALKDARHAFDWYVVSRETLGDLRAKVTVNDDGFEPIDWQGEVRRLLERLGF